MRPRSVLIGRHGTFEHGTRQQTGRRRRRGMLCSSRLVNTGYKCSQSYERFGHKEGCLGGPGIDCANQCLSNHATYSYLSSPFRNELARIKLYLNWSQPLRNGKSFRPKNTMNTQIGWCQTLFKRNMNLYLPNFKLFPIPIFWYAFMISAFPNLIRLTIWRAVIHCRLLKLRKLLLLKSRSWFELSGIVNALFTL